MICTSTTFVQSERLYDYELETGTKFSSRQNLHVEDMRENVGGDLELLAVPFVSWVWQLCMDLYRDMGALYNSCMC